MIHFGILLSTYPFPLGEVYFGAPGILASVTFARAQYLRWIIEKARVPEKSIYFCFIDYAKSFDCVDHNKLWEILKEMGILGHLTYLLRNLYAGQKVTVRTGRGTTDWFQIGKGVCQG